MAAFLPFLRTNAHWLAAGFLLTFGSSFGQTFFISVFAGEIRAEFGLSHGAWGGIYTLATTASAAVMIFAGGMTDRFRARTLGIGVLLMLACAALLMSMASAVWMLVLAIFFLRLTGQGMMGHVAMVSMARWFVATRGRAVSVAGLGVALGEASLPIIFVALMAVFDWRLLWLAVACVMIALVPVLARLLRTERTPRAMAEETQSLGMDGRAWRRGEVLRHWMFWMLLPTLVGIAAFNTALFFHQVHFADAKGWSHAQLVALFPVFTTTGVATMLVSGWALDRFGTARMMQLYVFPLALGYVVLSVSESPLVAAGGFVLMGMTQGIHATLSASIWAVFFGTRHLGAIRAMAAAFMVFGTAVGPGVTGVLIDAGVSFDTQLLFLAGYFVIAGALASIAAVWGRRALPWAAQIDVIRP